MQPSSESTTSNERSGFAPRAPSVEASCRTLRHLKQREKEPYLLQAFESSGVRAAVAQLDQLTESAATARHWACCVG